MTPKKLLLTLALTSLLGFASLGVTCAVLQGGPSKADIASANAEVQLLTEELNTLPVGSPTEALIVERINELGDIAEDVNTRYQSGEEEGWWGLLDAAIGAAAIFIPGAGIAGILLRIARRATANVVSSIEAGKQPDGTVNWAVVSAEQDRTGVSATVKKLRNTAAVAPPTTPTTPA